MASSTYSQNASKSDGLGNFVAASGVIYASSPFFSLLGRNDTSVVRSHTWVEDGAAAAW